MQIVGNHTLYHGDMLEVIKTLPESSIDSCVTDPPYHLTSIQKRFGKEGSAPAKHAKDGSFARLSVGFMGKKWDGGDIAFRPETWAGVYRILKPGAYLLAFGGDRTYHRMACAVEDAGFIINGTAVWAYGCLSEDTEILTSNGWGRVGEAIRDSGELFDGYDVLCYDIGKDTFEFHQPTEIFIYENKHTAYRIQSDYTDQIVSRNHRCIVERCGRKVFACAEILQRKESVPFLESLQDLPEDIPNYNTGSSIKKTDLLERVRNKERIAENDRQDNSDNVQKGNTSKVRNMWKRILQSKFLDKEKTNVISLLFSQLCVKGKVRSSKKHKPSWETSVDRKKFSWFYRKNERGEQSGMEGWRYPKKSSWKLSRGKICEVSKGILRNVAQRRLCYVTSPDNGTIYWQTAFENRDGTPYQSRSNGQQDRKPNVVQEQSRTQVIRSTKAKVTPVNYKGKVWCIEVPTGAFVARRNGKIFITGNSGFPKALDISKSIDQKLGAKREVSGEYGGCGYKSSGGSAQMGVESGYQDSAFTGLKRDVPVTEEAQLWSGWRTALKPAIELIVIAMKPLDGTYAENALKWGVAGFNIDGSRIPTNGEEVPINRLEQWSGFGQLQKPDYEQEINPKGRYPSNLIIDDSDEVVAMFPQTGVSSGGRIGNKGSMLNMMGTEYCAGDPGFGDSGSAARFFYCAKASRSERNAGLDDMPKKQRDLSRNVNQPSMNDGEGNPYNRGVKEVTNFHPTVKPIALMEYLVRLTKTPTGGVVLDPFMGSGTTGCASELEDRQFIGIEMDDEYFEIAQKRIEYYVKQPKQRSLFD